MNEELQQTVDESSQALKSPARRYKFMTNVLVRAQDKETFIKLLKKVTKDAMVPTLRCNDHREFDCWCLVDFIRS